MVYKFVLCNYWLWLFFGTVFQILYYGCLYLCEFIIDLKYAFFNLFKNCMNTQFAYTRKDYIENTKGYMRNDT